MFMYVEVSLLLISVLTCNSVEALSFLNNVEALSFLNNVVACSYHTPVNGAYVDVNVEAISCCCLF